MAWTIAKADNVSVAEQDSKMSCWLACYKMILNGVGLNWDLNMVEKNLVKGGFKNAPKCREKGLTLDEFKSAAEALGMGVSKTSDILTLENLKQTLKMYGPLWVATQLEFVTPDGNKQNAPDMVVILGVDEEAQKVLFINPLRQNGNHEVMKVWGEWEQMREGLTQTADIEGSLQFCGSLNAFRLAARNN